MGIDTTDAKAQFARIHRMIEESRRAKRRRLRRRAIRWWRRTEADRQRLRFEAQPERVH
jgi:hypothetical protein